MTADTKNVVRYRAVLSHGLIEVESHPAGSFVLFTDYERVVGELNGLVSNYTQAAIAMADAVHKHGQEIHSLRTALAASRAEVEGVKKDAERYRWLRNPNQDVALVLDKVVGETPMDEQGYGGYKHYEYRAGDELDSAVDAAMAAMKEQAE